MGVPWIIFGNHLIYNIFFLKKLINIISMFPIIFFKYIKNILTQLYYSLLSLIPYVVLFAALYR